MAVGYICTKNGTPEWAICTQNSVRLVNPRLVITVDAYEEADQNGKDYFDSVMNPAGFFYFTENPIPEDEI